MIIMLDNCYAPMFIEGFLNIRNMLWVSLKDYK